MHLKWLELIKSRYFFHDQTGALLNVVSNKASPIWQELRACFPIVNAFLLFTVNNGKKLSFGKTNGQTTLL